MHLRFHETFSKHFYVLLWKKGAFFTYAENILAFIDHLPTLGWHLSRKLLTNIRENLHTVDIFSITYLPRLVDIVCERPKITIFKNILLKHSFIKIEYSLGNYASPLFAATVGEKIEDYFFLFLAPGVNGILSTSADRPTNHLALR